VSIVNIPTIIYYVARDRILGQVRMYRKYIIGLLQKKKNNRFSDAQKHNIINGLFTEFVS